LPDREVKDVISAKIVGAQRHNHFPVARCNLANLHKLETGVISGRADVRDCEVLPGFCDAEDQILGVSTPNIHDRHVLNPAAIINQEFLTGRHAAVPDVSDYVRSVYPPTVPKPHKKA